MSCFSRNWRTGPIGLTGGHPIWSLDRGGWIAARALAAGERLATSTGEALVESVLPMAGRQAVYSLYVEADHRYLVGHLGVLVHNANPCTRVQGGTPAIQAAAKQLEVARAQLRVGMERHYGSQAILNMEAHHGIPVELLTDPQVSSVILRAVKGGFKFNGVDNGVIAPAGQGPHANYTAWVKDFIRANPEAARAPGEARALLQTIVAEAQRDVSYWFGT
jgi:hypothetical protein